MRVCCAVSLAIPCSSLAPQPPALPLRHLVIVIPVVDGCRVDGVAILAGVFHHGSTVHDDILTSLAVNGIALVGIEYRFRVVAPVNRRLGPHKGTLLPVMAANAVSRVIGINGCLLGAVPCSRRRCCSIIRNLIFIGIGAALGDALAIQSVLHDGYYLALVDIAIGDAGCCRCRADSKLVVGIGGGVQYGNGSSVCRPRAPVAVAVLYAIIKVVVVVNLRLVYVGNGLDSSAARVLRIVTRQRDRCRRKRVAAALRERHLIWIWQYLINDIPVRRTKREYSIISFVLVCQRNGFRLYDRNHSLRELPCYRNDTICVYRADSWCTSSGGVSVSQFGCG